MVGLDTGGGLDITWHQTKASLGATEADMRPAGVTLPMVNYRWNKIHWLNIHNMLISFLAQASCSILELSDNSVLSIMLFQKNILTI